MDVNFILSNYDAMFGIYSLKEIEAYLYENMNQAKKEGDKHGFSVFFGFEQKFTDGNDEYIVLGI